TGHSHYINSEAGLPHPHRLRALVDAGVIGVGTALTDGSQITVRRVGGPKPGRGGRGPKWGAASPPRGLGGGGGARARVCPRRARAGRETSPPASKSCLLPRTTANSPPAPSLPRSPRAASAAS